MESTIELYVNGPSTGTTQGMLDLFGDEPISIYYGIADIRDISKNRSVFSQNFTVPATKNNNTLFSHIFNIGSDSLFDASKKTPAYLLVDSQMVFNGSLQLINVKIKNKIPISYDVVIYGESANLVKTLSDSYITDLSFLDLNHNKTIDTIMSSWTANTANLGYYYPLIDYGFDLSLSELNSGILTGSTYAAYSSMGNGLNPEIFQPALSVKYLFDKIFNTAGFSYESEFLNSDIFTELILPFNLAKTSLLGEDYLDSISFRAFLSADMTPASTGTFKTPFNNDSTLGGFDNGFIYSASTSEYISNSTTAQKFGTDILSDYTAGSVVNPSISYSYVDVYFMRSTLTGSTIAIPGGKCFFHATQTRPNTLTQFKNSFVTPALDNTSSSPSNYLYPLSPNEKIWCYVTIQSFIGVWGTQQARLLKTGTSFYNLPQSNVYMNGPVFYKYFVPKQIKQIDFIKSIITMFQLMVIPSKDNPKKLHIIPRVDYFKNSETKNWSSKLKDVSQPIEELFVSEQQSKQIVFSYKSDKDYYNTSYTEDTKKIYGEFIQSINNEWLDPTSKQEIKIIFSPTPMDCVSDCEEIILPKIGKLESNGAFGKTDFNIRILRKNPTLMPLTGGNTIKMLGKAAQASYPYCGDLDHPFFSTINYNFGTSEYAFYYTPGFNNLQSITPNNLVNLYWKDYLNYISDKNSKIIKCRIDLSPADIAQFNYNDKIYIEGLTDDGGHYFYINKITYIPTSNDVSVVELIKI